MKIKLKYFTKFCDPYFFTKILLKEGVSVGQHTVFYSPMTQTIDKERPWMLKIGDYCKIAKGSTILCHDYSRSVLRRVYGDIVGEAKTTIIGDNVFVGMNSTILMGSKIGNNVIIGAGSVVSGEIPDNVVVAGNPARIIRTLDEHYEIRKRKTLDEAAEYFMSFKNYHLREPLVSEMGPFFVLFLDRSLEAIKENGIVIICNGDNKEEVISDFLSTDKVFSNFDEFKQWVNKK